MFELTFTLNQEVRKLRDGFSKFTGSGRYNVWILFLKEAAQDLMGTLIAATPVGERGGGTARASWSLRSEGKGVWKIENTATSDSSGFPYARTLEEGSLVGSRPWPSPGKRTVQMGPKVYSDQAVGGILANARIVKGFDIVASRFLDRVFKDMKW